jgi:hypothetical protein
MVIMMLRSGELVMVEGAVGTVKRASDLDLIDASGTPFRTVPLADVVIYSVDDRWQDLLQKWGKRNLEGWARGAARPSSSRTTSLSPSQVSY